MTKLITTILTLGVLTFNAQEAVKTRSVVNMKEKLDAKNRIAFNKDKVKTTCNPVKNNPTHTVSEKNNLSVANFTSFSSSANIYGVIAGAAKPLHYNDDVNAVSFIHRKSATYVGAPSNNTGVIVAMISNNWGANWDSTCIYSDATNFGRYPQGAIYNPLGNTNIANAYVVGSGPTTNGAAWTGNWFASKQLGAPSSTVYNNVASSVTNAQQFFSAGGPFGPNVYSNNFAQYGFSSADNGKVRSLGILAPDPDAAPIDAKGAVIQTGIFTGGVFTWSTDSFAPPVVIKSDLYAQMNSNAVMAWNEAGTVGYVVFIGSRTGQTLSNTGWQPIVYKTTNSGASWTLLPGIDFNNPAFQIIKNRLEAVPTNSTLAIPFFNPFEGVDCAVDVNNKLHIAAIIASTGSAHNDSLSFTNEYTLEQYTWPHTPGKRPYLYDFIGDGTTAWDFITVDSLSSEAPSSVSGGPGFNDNPWDDDQGKVTSDARVQLSRSPNGQYIVYTFAESDTNFTNGAKKWNTLPNVKARVWCYNSPFISATEINITKPVIGQNPNVVSRAMFHFSSPTTSSASIVTGSVQVKMPLTVTNSNPYIQGGSNTHYYTTETLNFLYPPTVGLNEVQNQISSFILYPNPAIQKCTVALDLEASADLEISVLNYLGQVVKQKNYKAQFGKNEIELDLLNINNGIYFVSIKNGKSTSTKKLVVE